MLTEARGSKKQIEFSNQFDKKHLQLSFIVNR